MFDSAALPVGQRIDAYCALYAPGADARAAGPDFSVSMRGWRLDRAVLYDRRLIDVSHRRDATRANRDALDHFTLTLVVSGDYHADAGNGFRRVSPGEILMMDTLRPLVNHAPNAHVLTLSLARNGLITAAGAAEGWHGHVIPVHRGFLLADHIASLARHGALLSPASLLAIGRVTLDLLSVALTPNLSREALDQGRAHTERRDRIRAVIAERLDDPLLGPEMLVEQFNLSRATLYRDFAPWGGLARYIRNLRLERLRERLSSGDPRPIGALAEAVGLDHEGRASDAFLKRFGQRPGAYRRMVLTESPFDGAHRRMGEWQSELR